MKKTLPPFKQRTLQEHIGRFIESVGFIGCLVGIFWILGCAWDWSQDTFAWSKLLQGIVILVVGILLVGFGEWFYTTIKYRLKTSHVIAFVVIFMVLIGLSTINLISTRRKQRVIVNDVSALVEDCMKKDDSNISIHGKCLVWDMKKKSLSDAHSSLPRGLRARSSDSKITVFMVLPERNVLVGHYNISGQPAYRKFMDVCVAYWPEKISVGMHSVVSREPRSSRSVNLFRKEYGDPIEPIVKWISSLPVEEVKVINGVVYDKISGLEWIAGPDKDTNWYEAKRWVETLNISGADWRMPKIKELETLYKEGLGRRNMTPSLKTTGWWVWSIETKDSSLVYSFYFKLGSKAEYSPDNSTNIRGVAVRSRK